MLRNEEELVSIRTVAREVGISEAWLKRLCQSGRYGRKVGNQWILKREEMEELKRVKQSGSTLSGRPTGRPSYATTGIRVSRLSNVA